MARDIMKRYLKIDMVEERRKALESVKLNRKRALESLKLDKNKHRRP